MAKQLSRSKLPLHDGVCFHCQQCAEKYLKGLMEELGLSIPKIHDLEQLFDDLLPSHPSLRTTHRGCMFLSNFAVTIRYPGDSASRRQARTALRWAKIVRTTARALLGIKPKKKRSGPS
jgi:HEPN domain-containing protein